MIQSNFQALMRDERGKVVPGSIRRSHNVFTRVGREVLTQLVAWDLVDTADVAFTQKRLRWFGVGSGMQAETVDVVAIHTPLEVEGTFGSYMKAVNPDLTTFPTVTSVKYQLVFDPGELSHGGAVTVTEAGMFSDVDSGSGPGLDYLNSDNTVSFYKTFDGLVKIPSFSLELGWELRF